MVSPPDYELLDFGEGRKLERFGGTVVDRPSPSAAGGLRHPELWKGAVRYDRERGIWGGPPIAGPWSVRVASLEFELHATQSGQVGIFPEQEVNWQSIGQRLQPRPGATVLNLFAYTGGSSLAAARAGAQVVHVDSSRSVVKWARRNAQASGLGNASIRWIVEDVPKFVGREIKRGNKYDGIILDPPSYGHGPNGEAWKLSRDLLELLRSCRSLLNETPTLFLLSCHTAGFGQAEMSAALSSCVFGSCAAAVRTRELALTTTDGRRLSAGYAAFWP